MGISLFFVKMDHKSFAELSLLSETQANEVVGEMETFDVEKSWDAIHFLLTGERSKWPNTSDMVYQIKGLTDQVKTFFRSGNLTQQATKPLMVPSTETTPLRLVIDGGFLFKHNLGMGSATYLDDRLTAEASTELAKVKEEDLTGRFDPERMKQLKIYPNKPWCDDDLRNYILPNFRDLKTFYSSAAGTGSYVLKFFG